MKLKMVAYFKALSANLADGSVNNHEGCMDI
jgi:hypothetical protein